MKVIQSLKHTWSLFILDWRRIFKNPIAIFLMAALVVIPSLYAWFNIKALWDPYSNTGELPIVPIPEQNSKTRTSKSGTRLSRTCTRINSSAGVSLTRRNKLSRVLSQVNTTQESTYQKNFQRIY